MNLTGFDKAISAVFSVHRRANGEGEGVYSHNHTDKQTNMHTNKQKHFEIP